MMMKKFMTLAAVAALVLTSCSNDTESIAETNTPANVVSFRAISDKTETKATPTDIGNFSNFTVNASTAVGTTEFDFMKALPVGRTLNSDTWTYAPLKYWPASVPVRFFAYSPVGSRNITAITPSATSATIAYTVPLTYKAGEKTQEDFLVASISASGGSAALVLAFKHALSMAGFQAKNLMSGMTVVVKGIELVNLDNTGVLTLTASTTSSSSTAIWSNNGDDFTHTYIASLPAAGVALPPSTTTAVSLTSANEYLTILPQDLSVRITEIPASGAPTSGTYVIVRYSTIDSDGKTVSNLTKYLALGSMFDKGKKYLFQFQFDEKDRVSFDVTIADWTPVGTVDNPVTL